MRALHHPSKAELNLPGVLFALSDPTRLSIIRHLADQGEAICAAVGVRLSKSSCSRHFKVLRESGVIRMRPQGAAYLNTLRREELDERFPGLLKAVLRSTGPSQCPLGGTTAARAASKTKVGMRVRGSS